MSENPPTIDLKTARHVANSVLSLRAGLLRQFMDKQGRNLDKECGYPENEPLIQTYQDFYDREGISTRVVGVYPDECWSSYPEVYEREDDQVTRFERQWKKLLDSDDLNPFYHLHKVDELSGIGRFGVLLFGLNDNKNLDEPAEGLDEDGRLSAAPPDGVQLTFLQPIHETLVEVAELETRKTSPRLGLPVYYNIRVSDTLQTEGGTVTPTAGLERVRIHWSRVLHVADNRMASRVYGVPRMRPVLNRLYDLRKILGGSAEMFWKGAFPGYSVETQPGLAEAGEYDAQSVKDEFKAFDEGLQRYLGLVGFSVKSLAPQVADPTNHVTQQLQAICATIGVPIRVFLGSEAGHLASTQDSVTWNRRLRSRQNKYLTPMVVRPFVNRLMALGVLPRVESYVVRWEDLNSMTDADRADVALKLTQALLQYVTSGAENVMPLKEFLVRILRFTPDEAEAIETAARKVGGPLLTTELWKQPDTAAGADPSARTSSGGKRNALG